MKAISLQPPWGWLIVNGPKDVENRTWWSSFTGRVIIHQSKQWDCAAAEVIRHIDRSAWEILLDNMAEAQSYGFIGEVNLCLQVDRHDSKWFFGPYAWPVKDPLAYKEAYPYPGKLMFFDVPDEILTKLRRSV